MGRSESSLSKELYMTEEELASLVSRGFYVGSHTDSHRWLNTLPEEVQKREIETSVNALSSIRGDDDRWIMCYPFGAFNETTLAILERMNFSLALTTRVGSVNIVSEPLGKFQLPRRNTNDYPQ